MPARHKDEVKAEAQKLMEAGQTLTEVARATGLPTTTLSEWAKAEGWQVTEVIRQVRIQEQRINVDPALDMLVKRMEGLPKADREAEYDDAMSELNSLAAQSAQAGLQYPVGDTATLSPRHSYQG